MTEKAGTFSLVLERPFSPFPVHQLFLMNDLDILFNRGRVPLATWNKNILTSNLQSSTDGGGNSGFVTFSSKYVNSGGWKYLSDQNKTSHPQMLKTNGPAVLFSPLVTIFSEEESADGEWAHGSFPLDEYVKALDRAKGELYYNPSLGMRYSKV